MHLKQRLVAFTIALLVAINLSGQTAAAPGGPVTLQSAAAAGRVEYTFNGTGASSGDSIKLKVKKTPGAGSEPITVTVPPGSMLRSSNSAAQDMVVSTVRGVDLGGGQFRAASEIVLADQVPVTVVLSAFCAQFDRSNPSPSTTFTLESPEPALACATRLGSHLPITSQQAAVWMFTDGITYDRMMRKMALMRQEWSAAETLAAGCRNATGATAPTAPATASEVLDFGERILARDPKNLVALVMVVSDALRFQEATPQQLAAEQGHARTLLQDLDSLKPGELREDVWNNGKATIIKMASTAMRYLTVLPGIQAWARQPRDCASAEAAYAKALAAYPEDAGFSFRLGTALDCLKRDSEAVYQFQRAAVIDPTLGGAMDAGRVRALAESRYVRIHGSDEGFAQLQDLVKSSPLPPDGFKIKTAAEVADDKRAEFKKTNPQLALWMGIKGQLADTNGDQYFTGSLKDADVKGQNGAKALKGTLVDAKPACKSKELVVAISDATHAEVTLNLDAALTGKPDTGVVIEWDGEPTAFTQEPFMLTMDTEKANITGLTLTPCTAAPVRKAAPKKSAPKKKSAD